MPRKSDALYDFFMHVNQDFLFCKRVFMSCDTMDQINDCSEWMNSVSDKWDVWLEKIKESLNLRDAIDAENEYQVRLKLMKDEWMDIYNALVSIIQEKQKEIQMPGFR